MTARHAGIGIEEIHGSRIRHFAHRGVGFTYCGKPMEGMMLTEQAEQHACPKCAEVDVADATRRMRS